MAAEVLAAAGVRVDVFEKMRSPGRKLLLAGRGGLNLTHTEPFESFLRRYGPAETFVADSIRSFDIDALRTWCSDLGEATFVGSSGRVFPASFRATPLLRAWLRRLNDLGVAIHTDHSWGGWGGAGGVLVRPASGSADQELFPDAVVLALGGASWPRTGSDGSWIPALAARGVRVVPQRPANCGFVVAWSDTFIARFGGVPVKNIRLTHADASVLGEVMVTAGGLEGGAMYALSRGLRDEIERLGAAQLIIDLVPSMSLDDLAARIGRGGAKESAANALRRVTALSAVAVGLVREATGNHLPGETAALAGLIKSLPIRLAATQPIARAISTAGGIALDEVDPALMLRRCPGVFVAGEMLDWEAPTGGYLLHATLATGAAAARGALKWVAKNASGTPSPPSAPRHGTPTATTDDRGQQGLGEPPGRGVVEVDAG